MTNMTLFEQLNIAGRFLENNRKTECWDFSQRQRNDKISNRRRIFKSVEDFKVLYEKFLEIIPFHIVFSKKHVLSHFFLQFLDIYLNEKPATN